MRPSNRTGRLVLVAVLAVMTLWLAAACGSDPTPTPRPTPTPTPAPEATPTVDAAAQFQAEWDALIAVAKDEGKLVIAAGSSGASNLRPVWDQFQEKFDIEVIVSTGRSQAVTDKLIAEQSANVFDVDLFMMDILRAGQVLDAGGLLPLPPLFIHPEVLDKSAWYRGDWLFADAQKQYVFTYSASAQTNNIVSAGYNTNLVTEDDIARIETDRDFIAPWFVEKFKGSVVMRPPPPYSVGGGGYYVTQRHPDLGPEFLESLMTVLDADWQENTRLAADGVAQGKYAWALNASGVASELRDMGREGLPVARFRKAMPITPYLSGGSSANQVAAPINPPHPNAAQLALNWFLAREGQTLRNEIGRASEDDFTRPSLRDDVPVGNSDPDTRRQPGVVYELCIECDPSEQEAAKEAYQFAQDVYEKLVGIQ